MVSGAERMLCMYFSNLGIGVKNDSLQKLKSVCPALFVPSGLRTNIQRSPWVYLHLRASLNTHKGSFGESRGKVKRTEVGTEKEGEERGMRKKNGQFQRRVYSGEEKIKLLACLRQKSID